MKIYTRTGDGGETGLFGGRRVPKNHARVDAYGTVDELNSVLGWALTELADGDIRSRLSRLQHDLFVIGAALATPPADEGKKAPRIPELPEGRVAEMEHWIDAGVDEVEPLKHFVLPGGARGAAALHVARTVCRRAERAVVSLSATDEVDGYIVRYLNRLSDLLFAMARLENHRAGVADVAWVQEEGAKDQP